MTADEKKVEELFDWILDHTDYGEIDHSFVQAALKQAIEYGRADVSRGIVLATEKGLTPLGECVAALEDITAAADAGILRDLAADRDFADSMQIARAKAAIKNAFGGRDNSDGSNHG